MPYRTIAIADLHTARTAGPATLIDVRTPAEFAAAHVPGAVNLPLDRLDASQVRALPAPVHVICQSGARSRQAVERLAAAGVEAVNVDGGTSGWQAQGLPVEGSGAATFGVERQVRLIIGLGVLSGAVLALTVHPWWAGLSGFFGAGLVMAGLTGACPLAAVIAALPWNRSATTGACCLAPPRQGA